jgi:DNA-binding NarL/FixJ family response regulator
MGTLRTYIIEDSPVIRENLIATLEEVLPVTVVGWADDGVAALRWLLGDGSGTPGHADCDLVIVDLFLKGGSGQAVLQAARRAQHPAKMVVLSNYATPYVRQHCLALGAHRVFDKSNDIEALIEFCGELSRASQ